jgi:phospholipid-binding lipoprotein MlaA
MDASAAGLLRRLVPLALLCLLAGCATPPADADALADYQRNNDPLEPTNRVLYAINDGLDTAIVRPAAMAYHALPQPVRNGVHNVLTNLHGPVQLGNDMLEGKPRRAGDTLMRFLINTTVGLVGIMDVASDWGYPDHTADFGLTLALWGIPEGPYLFVPLIGPSNFRDIGGYGIDIVGDPLNWIGQGAAVTALRWSRAGVRGIDTRERLDKTIEDIKRNSLDPYATFRSAYGQSRAAQVQEIRDDQRATVPAWFAQPNKP